MLPNILLRADGDHKTGLGHLYRSLALFNILSGHYSVKLATKTVEFASKLFPENSIIDLSACVNEMDFYSEKKDLYKALVLDGYHFNLTYQEKVKKLGIKIILIDDFAKGPFVADLIINHAPNAENLEGYKNLPEHKKALGLEYVILRPEFNRKKEPTHSIDKKGIFICIGATDPNKIAVSLIEKLRTFSNEQVNLIASKEYISDDSCKKLNVKRFYNLNAETLKKVIITSKVAITSASTISLEVCASHTPLLAGYYVDNQINLYNGLVKKQICLGLENFNSLEADTLEKKLKFLTTNDSIVKNQQKLFDFKNTDRIITKITSLL